MYEKTEQDVFDKIINAFELLDEVDCIALGGSRSTGKNDKNSDYDIYVYCLKELTEEQRSSVLLPFCSEAEIGNHYWESEDNCVMSNGISIDVIYRSVELFKKYLEAVVDNAMPTNGYTTCFWHNIVNSKVLFDKSGEFTKMQKEYTVPYPEQLRKNIIENNRKLLSGCLPSYDKQIKKACLRGDIVSVHHRITEFLASYFDIIFALNRMTHPGEKRLVQICKDNCKILPEKFEENINALLGSILNGNSFEIVTDMIAKLDKTLESSF